MREAEPAGMPLSQDVAAGSRNAAGNCATRKAGACAGESGSTPPAPPSATSSTAGGSPALESPAAAASANQQETLRRSRHTNSRRRARFKTPHAYPRGHDGTCKASNSRRPGLRRDRLTHGLALRSGGQASTIPRAMRSTSRKAPKSTNLHTQPRNARNPHGTPVLLSLHLFAYFREWVLCCFQELRCGAGFAGCWHASQLAFSRVGDCDLRSCSMKGWPCRAGWDCGGCGWVADERVCLMQRMFLDWRFRVARGGPQNRHIDKLVCSGRTSSRWPLLVAWSGG
jgi:hypothetical protein